MKRKRDDTENTTADTATKRGKKASSNSGRARKQTVADDDEISLISEQFTRCLRKKGTHTLATAEEIRNMSIDTIQDLSNTWLEDIEKMRRKSKNLNGVVSGVIGDRVLSLKDLLQYIIEKVQSNGDPVFYQMRVREVTN